MASDVVPNDLEAIPETEALKSIPPASVDAPTGAPAAPSGPVAAPVLDSAGDLEPVSENTAHGKYVDHEGKPLARFRTMDEFKQQFTSRLRSGEINDQNEAQAFADDFAPAKILVDAKSTIAERDKGAHVTDETVDNNTVVNWIQHLRAKGQDTSQIDKLPVRDQLKLANADFQKQVAAYLQEHVNPHLAEGNNLSGLVTGKGPDPAKASFLERLGMGTVSSTGDLVDGLTQSGYRLADVLGALDHAKAETGFDAVAWDNKVRNAALVHGRAGEVGKFAGEVLQTGIVPMAASERAALKFPRLANFVTRSLGGAAIGAMEPSDNYDQQAGHILTNMAATPLMIPIVEKLGAKLGQAGMSAYLALANKYMDQGIADKLFDKSGAVTAMGRALAARFVGAGAPPDIARQTLEAIAKHNPAEIASDVATPIMAIADKEGVPLTKAVKTQDPPTMQTVESAGAGAYGKEVERHAVNAAKGTRDAMLDNVEAIGSGQGRVEAATNAADAIKSAEGEAADAVDAKYTTLKASPEPLSRDGQAALKASLHDAYDELGQAGVDTLSPKAKAFAMQLNALTESKRLPRFGEVWKLSRQINQASRDLYGTAEGVDVSKIKAALDNWMQNAQPSHLKMGDNGVFQELTSANSDYKQLMDKFGNRPDRIRGGGNLTDPVGKSVATIVSLAKQAGPSGMRAGSDISKQVEQQIFGGSKEVFSTQAANIVSHLAKVAPEAMPHVLDLFVNRLADHVTETGAAGGSRGALSFDKLHKAITSTLETSREGLKALGMTDAQITSLGNNAWLASKMKLPPEARNVGSSKINRASVAWAFRRSFGLLAGAVAGFEAGSHGLAAHGLAEGAGMVVGSKVADVVEKRIASDAISGTVPRAPNAGREVGATTLKALAKGALAAGDQSRVGRD